MARKNTAILMSTQLPGLLNEFYASSTTSQRRQTIESQLCKLTIEKDYLKQVLTSIQNNKEFNTNLLFFQVNTIYIHCKEWVTLEGELKLEIFQGLQNLLMSNLYPIPIQTLAIKGFAEILRNEWPHNMNDFFSNIYSMIIQDNRLGWMMLVIIFEELFKDKNSPLINPLSELVPSILKIGFEKLSPMKKSDSAYSSPTNVNINDDILAVFDVLFMNISMEKFVNIELIDGILNLVLDQNQTAFNCIYEMLSKQLASPYIKLIVCHCFEVVCRVLEVPNETEEDFYDKLIELGGILMRSYSTILEAEQPNLVSQYLGILSISTPNKLSLCLPIWHNIIDVEEIKAISTDGSYYPYKDIFHGMIINLFNNLPTAVESNNEFFGQLDLLSQIVIQIGKNNSNIAIELREKLAHILNTHQYFNLRGVFFKLSVGLLMSFPDISEFLQLAIDIANSVDSGLPLNQQQLIFESFVILNSYLKQTSFDSKQFSLNLANICAYRLAQPGYSNTNVDSIANCFASTIKHLEMLSSTHVHALMQSFQQGTLNLSIEIKSRIFNSAQLQQILGNNVSMMLEKDFTPSYISQLFISSESYNASQRKLVYGVFSPIMEILISNFNFGPETTEFVKCYGYYYRTFNKNPGFPRVDMYSVLLNSPLLESNLNYFEVICQQHLVMLINGRNANYSYELIHCRAVNAFKSQSQLPLSYFELVKELVLKYYKQDEMPWIISILTNEVDRMQIETLRIILDVVNTTKFNYEARLVEKLVQAWGYGEYALLKDNIMDSLWVLAQMNSELFTSTIITNSAQKNIQPDAIITYFNSVDTAYSFKQAMLSTIFRTISYK